MVPRDVVVSLLPDPKDLAGRMRGKTCVGTLARGRKNGESRAFYIYNVADHETAYAELGVQATAYQTGIPPVIAARLIARGPLGRARRPLARGVRSRSVPRAAGARGHAVARAGRYGAGGAAEGAHPAVAGDRGGLAGQLSHPEQSEGGMPATHAPFAALRVTQPR